jgi:hypothetical protein
MFFPNQKIIPPYSRRDTALMKNQFDYYRKTSDVRSQKKKRISANVSAYLMSAFGGYGWRLAGGEP